MEPMSFIVGALAGGVLGIICGAIAADHDAKKRYGPQSDDSDPVYAAKDGTFKGRLYHGCDLHSIAYVSYDEGETWEECTLLPPIEGEKAA